MAAAPARPRGLAAAPAPRAAAGHHAAHHPVDEDAAQDRAHHRVGAAPAVAGPSVAERRHLAPRRPPGLLGELVGAGRGSPARDAPPRPAAEAHPPAGSRLPSEPELSAEFGVNRLTIRQAIAEL
ncbi:GntR family transcriptional regulator, partial [Nonomuraea sp. NPDC055795]